MPASLERLWVAADMLRAEDVRALAVIIHLRDEDLMMDWRALHPGETIEPGDEWCCPGDEPFADSDDYMAWTPASDDDIGLTAGGPRMGDESGAPLIFRRRADLRTTARQRVAAVLESVDGIRKAVPDAQWVRLVDALAALVRERAGEDLDGNDED